MPATTSAPSRFKADENGRNKFVRCELTAGQKVDLKRWRDDGASAEALLAYLDQRVMSGHTWGCKGQEVGFMATVTGVRETSGHVGVCLAARGSTPSNALYALQYKDEVLLKGKWEVVDWASELDL
jgi:hypothetical protein